jgi:hypothetical protein
VFSAGYAEAWGGGTHPRVSSTSVQAETLALGQVNSVVSRYAGIAGVIAGFWQCIGGEARNRTDEGFAEPCLTTWLPRHRRRCGK